MLWDLGKYVLAAGAILAVLVVVAAFFLGRGCT
jgi:hypothetical protein